MAIGPNLIYDKSVLQALNLDESVLLDCFFATTITPVFYAETLADLARDPKAGRPGAKIVSELANKSPSQNSVPNIHHQTLVTANLRGNHVNMTSRPMIGGAEPRQDSQGRRGFVHEGFSEAKAFDRWRNGEFQEVERLFASGWRATLSNLDFEGRIAWVSNMVGDSKFSTLRDIRSFVAEVICRPDRQHLLLALQFLDIPYDLQPEIVARFDEAGETLSMDRFAPYASHVLSVALVFYIGLLSGHISKERPSNLLDVAYLYYLPFCNAFVSGDNLHSRLAPHFLKPSQRFVVSEDLKSALKEIGAYYEANCWEEIQREGLLRYATYPPTELDNAVTQLYDLCLPDWRERAKKPKFTVTKEQEAEIVRQMFRHADSQLSEDVIDSDTSDFVVIKKKVHRKLGKWQILPPELP